jgi:hypothetical protein
MRMQLLLTEQKIVGIDPVGESLARDEFHPVGKAQGPQRAMPLDPIVGDFPDVGDIARCGEGGEHGGKRLAVIRTQGCVGRIRRNGLWIFSHSALTPRQRTGQHRVAVLRLLRAALSRCREIRGRRLSEALNT